MSSSMVNKTNAHTGNFLSSNEGPVVGCTGKGKSQTGKIGIKNYRGLVGGKKKRRKSRKKRRASSKRTKSKRRSYRKHRTKRKSRRRKHRGGATMEPLNPTKGLMAMVTRGGNGSRGLSASELKTIRGGGNGYGMTANDASTQAAAGTPSGIGHGYHLKAGTSVTGYKNCGLIPAFKLGASSNFKGVSDIQVGAGQSANAYNQYSSAGYGYSKPVNGNKFIAGSYAPITSTSKSQKCGTGGKRRKRRRKTRRTKGGNNLKQLMYPITKITSGVSKSLKNTSDRLGSMTMMSDKMIGGKKSKRGGNMYKKCGQLIRRRGMAKRKRASRKRSKKQRGGYAQFGSNSVLSNTMQLPAGPQGSSWDGQLASPPTYMSQNLCNDNYNHFTGKGSPSPVLDQAAP